MYYSKEDEIVIDEAWQDLKQSCNKICKGEDDHNLINRAFFLAKEAHQGVRRRSGEPYLLHPIAVAKIVIEEIGLGVKSVVAALLHDVVEDTPYTFEDLLEMGFPEKVVDALRLLTHEKDTPYMDYVKTLKSNPIARAVKLADLRHNSDMSRLDNPDERAMIRAEKYRAAIALLEE